MTEKKEKVLEELDFGGFVAELEEDLPSIFVPTRRIENEIFISPPPDLILGPKGSGKSAIFKLFSDHEEYVRNNYISMFSECDNEVIIGSGTGQEDELKKGLVRLNSDIDDFDPEEYWRIYFVLKIAYLLKENGYTPDGSISELLREIGESDDMRLATIMRKVYKTVVGRRLPEKIETPAGPFSIVLKDKDTEGLLAEESKYLKDNNISVWIFIDRIDQIKGDREEMKESIEGLFEAQIFLQTYEGIEPKIFARSDIWEFLTIVNQDYLRKTRLSWSERELITLVNKRMLENETVRKYIDEHTGKNLDLTNIATYKKQTQKTIFNTIFVKKIVPGQTGGTTSQWMISRVTNGKGDVYPRELINLCKEAKMIQLRKNTSPDQGIIGRKSLKDALSEVSRNHVEDVLKEYEKFNPHYDELIGGETRYSRSELKDMFAELTPSGDKAIKQLYYIGLLKPEEHGRYTADEFSIPWIYRDGLDIVSPGRR